MELATSNAHVALADADVELLTSRVVPLEQPLDAWPVSPPPGAATASLECGAELERMVRDRPGYAVVDTRLAEANDDVVCSAAWNLFSALWRPVPQYPSGELLFPVEVRPGAPAASYSHTNASGNFHTDGALLPEPPEVAALFCLSDADAGGETVLIEGDALAESMAATDGGLVDALLAEHPVDCHGQSPGTDVRWQPVAARGVDGRLRLRYLRRYVEDGYRRTGRDIAPETRAAFDFVDRVSAAPEHQIAVPLSRGQLLVWSNPRFLHGRRAFREVRKRRRLRRAYGTWPPRD